MKRNLISVALVLSILLWCSFSFVSSAFASSGEDVPLPENVVNQTIAIETISGSRTGQYTGQLVNGAPHGYGVFESQNPSGVKWFYIGEFRKGCFYGNGNSFWLDGNSEHGEYINGALSSGEKTVPLATVRYNGTFDHDEDSIEGFGDIFDIDGELIYRGKFSDFNFSTDIDDGSNTNTVSASNTPDTLVDNSGGNKPEGENDSPFTVVAEYSWEAGRYSYVALIVKNNTYETVEISGRVIFKDKTGNPIGVKNASEKAIGHDCETILLFSNDEPFAGYEYEIDVAKETYYKSILQNLEIDLIKTDRKAIVSVKNNGDIAAQFVEGYVFFMHNGSVVNEGSSYFTDGDYEIKPGKTEMMEFTARQAYDSVFIYLTGYGR